MDIRTSPLLTDLYQLNMIQGYLDHGMTDTAVFEFFARKLPPGRGFLLAAGLEQALVFLETTRFGDEELAWLKSSGRFRANAIDYLAAFRFSGDVHGVREGTPVFADEPILRVTAPLPEAQLVETRLINILHFQTLIAAKAARMVLAAAGRPLVDFGLRRAHAAEAGLFAARAAYLAGFAGSATVAAGAAYGVPLFGTIAHAFVQAHDDETLAFEHFARSRPEGVVLLIDTYDTPDGARRVVDLAPRLAADGITVRGVRLDSGDLAQHARTVRAILDAGDLAHVQIFASGGLDETKIAALVRGGAPIDAFGVGSSLVTGDDAAALDCAYKLQEYAGLPRRKHSEGKVTWPGRKQIFRRRDADGRIIGDVLTVEGDAQDGTPLVERMMQGGRRTAAAPSLEASRERAAAEIAALPAELRRLDATPPVVTVAPALSRLADETDRRRRGA